MVLGDTDRCPWDMGTFGSLTTRMFGPALRAAAAKARGVLTTLAAERLGVAGRPPVARARRGSVAGEAARRVTYGELSKGARIVRRPWTQPAVLRAAADFHVMGRSLQRLDGIDKVTGAAQYAADMRLPGMLYARILRPPVHGATLRRPTPAQPRTCPASSWSRSDDLIAVLHADPDAAAEALARIHAEWQPPEADAEPGSIFEHLRMPALKASRAPGRSGGTRRPAQAFETTYREGLRRPRPDRAARGARRGPRRQGNGLGIHADAVPDPR